MEEECGSSRITLKNEKTAIPVKLNSKNKVFLSLREIEL